MIAQALGVAPRGGFWMSIVTINLVEGGADYAALINAALADPGVTEVHLGAGLFEVDAPIYVPSGKTLSGEGAGETMIKISDDFSRPSPAGVVNSELGAVGITLRDFSIDCDRFDPVSRQQGTFMEQATDFTIEGVDVYNATGYAHFARGNVSQINAGNPDAARASGTYTDCNTFNSQVHFEQMGCEDITLVNCTATDGDGDISVEAYFHPLVGSRNITYIGCTAIGDGLLGFSLISLVQPLENIRIEDCYVEISRFRSGLGLGALGPLETINLEIVDSTFISRDYIGVSMAGVSGTATGSTFRGGVIGFDIGSLKNGTLSSFVVTDSIALGLVDPATTAGAYGINAYGPGLTWEGGTIEARGKAGYMYPVSKPSGSTFVIDISPETMLVKTGFSAIGAFIENGAPSLVAPAIVLPASAAGFAAGKIVLDVQAHGAPADVFFVAGGINGITISGNEISFNGAAIGHASGGLDGADLVIQLSPDVSADAVQAVLRSIAYATPSEDPTTRSRLIEIAITDAGGATSRFSSATMVTAVNDAPTLEVAADAATVSEGGTIVFDISGGDGIRVLDVDSDSITVELEASKGVLTLAATTGLNVTGNGTSSLRLTGTIVAVNAALDGLAYTGLADLNGEDTLAVTLIDGSFTLTDSIGIWLEPDSIGTEGDDTLYNNLPDDPETVLGLGGNDRITITVPVRDTVSVIHVDGGTGFDTAELSAAFFAPDGLGGWLARDADGNEASITFANIERLVLTGGWDSPAGFLGGGGEEWLTLTSAAPGLVFNLGAGNDLIDVSSLAGAYTLIGGQGDDVYVVGSGHNVVELSGEGIDEVRTSLSQYTLPSHVERLAGTSAGGQILRGNGLNNVLTGSGGSDILYLDAGGIDQAFGGEGNDFLYFGASYSPADRAEGGSGRDYIILEGNYLASMTLSGSSLVGIEGLMMLSGGDTRYNPATGTPLNYTFVTTDDLVASDAALEVNAITLVHGERLVFDGSAETEGRFTFYGSAGEDRLTGGGGNDFFDGGAGRDRMTGGAGDDIYYVDHVLDIVLEAAGGGFDQIYTSVSLGLQAGQEIEFLGTLNKLGTEALTLRGNDTRNTIAANNGNNNLYGEGGNDTLYGFDGNDNLFGGTGADYMIGGLGNDVYRIDDSADIVQEEAGQGQDTAYTSVSYTLPAGSEIEQLATIDWHLTDAINLTGNELANQLLGNNGANTILGRAGNDRIDGEGGDDLIDGGSGRDTLEGGTGNDVFRFSAREETSIGSHDTILDFLKGDLIDLSLIDADETVDGNQTFAFSSDGLFHNAVGELRVRGSNGLWFVEGDVNGDGVADFAIEVRYSGADPIIATDFIL
jgi:Ca2+-binding RTX toxin-like protein